MSIENSGLAIDRALDDRGIISPLKKATEEDPRGRAVIIPEITLMMQNAGLRETLIHRNIRGWFFRIAESR